MNCVSKFQIETRFMCVNDQNSIQNNNKRKLKPKKKSPLRGEIVTQPQDANMNIKCERPNSV